MSGRGSGLTMSTNEAIESFVHEACNDSFTNRRSETRHPFFVPVSLRDPQQGGDAIPAFSRDLSLSGLGLLHHARLEPGCFFEVTFVYRGREVQSTAEVLWCREAGEGWFMSGCRFIPVE